MSSAGEGDAGPSPAEDVTAPSSPPPATSDPGLSSAGEQEGAAQSSPRAESEASAEAENNFLDDLRRVQADFDNYRKRMLREQTQLAQRASARLVEGLLPVLDNFESAIAHGEGGGGVELVYRELRRVLEEEGLAEIPAEDRPFDPRVHEAFEAVEDESVDEPTVRSVLRRGYTLRDQVLRPSMVSVARPPEAGSGSEDSDEASADVEPGSAEEQDAAEG